MRHNAQRKPVLHGHPPGLAAVEGCGSVCGSVQLLRPGEESEAGATCRGLEGPCSSQGWEKLPVRSGRWAPPSSAPGSASLENREPGPGSQAFAVVYAGLCCLCPAGSGTHKPCPGYSCVSPQEAPLAQPGWASLSLCRILALYAKARPSAPGYTLPLCPNGHASDVITTVGVTA